MVTSIDVSITTIELSEIITAVTKYVPSPSRVRSTHSVSILRDA